MFGSTFTGGGSGGGGGGYTEGAHVYNNAAISIPASTWTDLTFNSERYDTDSIHDTAVNSQRLTCKTAGIYIIMGAVTISANSVGTRTAAIHRNGTTYIAVDTRQNLGGGDAVQVVVSVIASLSVGDYVTLRIYQNSAGALNVNFSSEYTPEFSIQRIG